MDWKKRVCATAPTSFSTLNFLVPPRKLPFYPTFSLPVPTLSSSSLLTMGVSGIFQRIYKKGYKADIVQAPLSALAKLEEGAKQHVDLQASIYATIRYAFSELPEHAAHLTVERKLQQFASTDLSILYLDGAPALEKKATHEDRAKTRIEALTAAASNSEHLVELVQSGQRPRKQHFTSVEDNLRKAFAWEAAQKQGLIQYLRSRDWNVVECATEADVEIGKVCGPNDVVVSGDSDLLMYDHINILWRPWRRGQFLQYTIPDILKTLDLSRAKWTTLGIVSANDYGKNIHGLGIASNIGIIKGLMGNGIVPISQSLFVNHHGLFTMTLTVISPLF